jgi:UPF0755 protein
MKKFATVVLATIIVTASIIGWRLYSGLALPYQGFSGEQFADIEPGMGPSSIGARLVSLGIVRDRQTWRVALWRSGASRHLKAGEYRFDHAMTVDEVIGIIARGEVYLRPITFPEGLTVAQMAKIFETRGFGPASAFVAAASDPAPVAALDPEARTLEGYLFPDTYRLTRRTTAADLVTQMAERFVAQWTPDRQAALAARGLTLRQLVTIASIVEKETAKPDERPMVSAVYQNRLKIRMGLQCDPTVIYALERVGRYTGNLTRADLSFDSPYNTYRYAGLPPGPIAAPGLASLDAALNPAPVDYLYFVSRNDGSHAFAVSLDDHNRNVHRYQARRQ